jgi:hypothetical protein
MGTVGRRSAVALGIAAGGMVLGHVLAYLIAFPVGAARHRHLMEAGHDSFHTVVTVAGLLAGAAAAAVVVRGLRTGGRTSAPLARSLAALQVGGFLLLEVIERHGRIDLALADPGVRVGVLVQVVVALALALLLRAFVGVVRAVVSLLRRGARKRPRPVPPPVVAVLRPPAAELLASARRRAPPDALAS